MYLTQPTVQQLPQQPCLRNRQPPTPWPQQTRWRGTERWRVCLDGGGRHGQAFCHSRPALGHAHAHTHTYTCAPDKATWLRKLSCTHRQQLIPRCVRYTDRQGSERAGGAKLHGHTCTHIHTQHAHTNTHIYTSHTHLTYPSCCGSSQRHLDQVLLSLFLLVLFLHSSNVTVQAVPSHSLGLMPHGT